jgi:Protein of unknown function (DUF998)
MFTRPLLYGGLLAPVVFVAGVLVEGATRPGYRAWRHAVSQLSLGPGWPVNVALILLAAAGLLALAIALPRALPGGDRPRSTPRLVATAGAAAALLVIFPIDPGVGYPPGQPAVHHWRGLVHGIVGTVLFAALAAAPLTLAHHLRGRGGWSSWRPYSLATGLTVAVAYPLTVVLSSLDQAGVWTNAPAGLAERVALIIGVGWCALLAGRLLETTARRPLDGAMTGGHA